MTHPRLSRLVCGPVCLLLLFALCLPARAAQRADPFEQLFNCRAFPAGPKDFPAYLEKHWTRVLAAEQARPCLQRAASCLPRADASQWLYLAGKAPAMDEMTLLRSVTAFFNKFPPASDMENYGVKDRWPTLADFFSRRSGDCKAYTLSKYFALRVLGLQDDKLRIVLVHMPERKANHAVLAVNTAKGIYILDNNTRPIDLILPQEKFASRFIPLYMLNAQGRWTFRQNPALLTSK